MGSSNKSDGEASGDTTVRSHLICWRAPETDGCGMCSIAKILNRRRRASDAKQIAFVAKLTVAFVSPRPQDRRRANRSDTARADRGFLNERWASAGLVCSSTLKNLLENGTYA